MAVIIRPASVSDAEWIRAIYAPYCRDTAVSFELEPPGVDDMRQRIATILTRYPWLVAEDSGNIMGYAYASRHRERAAYQWSVDVTVYIDPEHQRRGVGRALYNSLFHVLRLQGFVNAFAGIALPNPASVGLHESLGFQHLGAYRQVGFKCGAWHDVGWWQLVLQMPPAFPSPPVAFPDIRETRECRAALVCKLPNPPIQ